MRAPFASAVRELDPAMFHATPALFPARDDVAGDARPTAAATTATAAPGAPAAYTPGTARPAPSPDDVAAARQAIHAALDGHSESALQLDLARGRPDGMAWPDYLRLLLRIGAELEHALMVQYLYAAYSLGGPQVPEAHRPTVRRWQNALLTVAREEMGHLITVQNLLRLVGGDVGLERENFPWDVAFAPFPFRLEPFTRRSLACYLFAEMPERASIVRAAADDARAGRTDSVCARLLADDGRVLDAIVDDVAAVMAADGRGRFHRVDEIYLELRALLADEVRIPDATFDAASFGAQASFEEWGKNYGPLPADAAGDGVEPTAAPRTAPEPSARGRAAPGRRRAGAAVDGPPPDPSRYPARVMVHRMATRTDALAALLDIAGQGEAPEVTGDDAREPSHFERFAEIYLELRALEAEQDTTHAPWTPARPVAVNPTAAATAPHAGATVLADPHTRRWAALANLRYEMLLTYLGHALRLPRPDDPPEPDARAGVLHRVFGEMYNTKAIAALLVRLPAGDPADPARRAGPPFELPPALALAAPDLWRVHLAHLARARALAAELRLAPEASDEERGYLLALDQLDAGTEAWLRTVVARRSGPDALPLHFPGRGDA